MQKKKALKEAIEYRYLSEQDNQSFMDKMRKISDAQKRIDEITFFSKEVASLGVDFLIENNISNDDGIFSTMLGNLRSACDDEIEKIEEEIKDLIK